MGLATMASSTPSLSSTRISTRARVAGRSSACPLSPRLLLLRLLPLPSACSWFALPPAPACKASKHVRSMPRSLALPDAVCSRTPILCSEWKFQEIEALLQSSLPDHVIPWIMHEANSKMAIAYPIRERGSAYSAHTYTFDESHFKLLSRQIQRTAPDKITAVFQWSLTLPVEKRSSGVVDYISGNEAAQIRGFLQAGKESHGVFTPDGETYSSVRTKFSSMLPMRPPSPGERQWRSVARSSHFSKQRLRGKRPFMVMTCGNQRPRQQGQQATRTRKGAFSDDSEQSRRLRRGRAERSRAERSRAERR